MKNLTVNELTLKKLSEILTPQEQQIILKRTCLNENEEIPTLKDLALEFNLPYENVKQLEIDANRKIISYLNSVSSTTYKESYQKIKK